MQLHGIHHVSAVTGKIRQNLNFYTETLGLRLVKKSVDQDEVNIYHLFYADAVGTPGTDITFFDWSHAGPNRRGTDSITNTMFRVNGKAALAFWLDRFNRLHVPHGGIETVAGRSVLRFEDPEGQRLTLMDDQGLAFGGVPWEGAGIPVEYSLRGFYASTLSTPALQQLEPLLTGLLGLQRSEQYASLDNPAETVTIYTMDGGGPAKELHIIEQPNESSAVLGAGGVHHVAFRLSDDKEQHAWEQRLEQAGMPNSGIIDRFYFRSIYFRPSPGILFELATDGPGFATDESLDRLGDRLALPPFLEPQRQQIEAGLQPI